MKQLQAVAMSVVLAVPLWAGVASAQSNKAACDAAKAGSPQKVEGKVVRIDQASGKVAVTEASGKTHEFQASKETLRDLKVGDTIEARLRTVPNC
jgi:Cu/Ag efflux protein CusF